MSLRMSGENGYPATLILLSLFALIKIFNKLVIGKRMLTENFKLNFKDKTGIKNILLSCY